MRLDELPKSARIEDRRGVTVARGGIGIGTIVVLGLIGWALGIDPRLLIGGAEMMSRSGGQAAAAGGRRFNDKFWKPIRHNGAVRVGRPRQYRDRVDRYFRASWENLQTTDVGHVLRGNAVRLRICKVRDGTVLLPTRSKGLSRHKFLSGPRRAFRACQVGSKTASSRKPM